MRDLITPDVPSVDTLAPARPGLIIVFFKEEGKYLEISLRLFDRYLHAGMLRRTNHYGWICLEDKRVILKRKK